MFAPSSMKMPVKFRDVTACFSEEEMKMLHESEKLFYRSVMKEIHQALITLGYHILNPDLLLRVITYVSLEDHNNPKGRAGLHNPTSSHKPAADPTSDIFLRIRFEEEQSAINLQISEETENCTVPITDPLMATTDSSLQIKEDKPGAVDFEGGDALDCDPGPLTATPDFSLQVKEEDEAGALDSEGRDALACVPGHQPIPPETDLHVNKWEDSAHVDAQDSKSLADLDGTITSISSPSDVGVRIQSEQEQCIRDAAAPEKGKMINGLETGTSMQVGRRLPGSPTSVPVIPPPPVTVVAPVVHAPSSPSSTELVAPQPQQHHQPAQLPQAQQPAQPAQPVDEITIYLRPVTPDLLVPVEENVVPCPLHYPIPPDDNGDDIMDSGGEELPHNPDDVANPLEQMVNALLNRLAEVERVVSKPQNTGQLEEAFLQQATAQCAQAAERSRRMEGRRLRKVICDSNALFRANVISNVNLAESNRILMDKLLESIKEQTVVIRQIETSVTTSLATSGLEAPSSSTAPTQPSDPEPQLPISAIKEREGKRKRLI